jgi:hypothetical protein
MIRNALLCLFVLAVFAGPATGVGPANAARPAAAAGQAAGPEAEPIGHTLTVPLDRRRPDLGGGILYYELGAPFDPKKPTVFAIADGQQFHVRKGSVAGIQKESFGPEFNVVGIVGRGFSEDILRKAVPDPEHVDWPRAGAIFGSAQWVEDIDAVRRDLLGKDGRILLYGASGGAFLVHQYLAAHGRWVQRAFTESAVMRLLESRLRINHDHFWREIGAGGPQLQTKLLQALRAHPERRPEMIQTLQRQNFFVPPERLPAERASLINELHRDDTEAIGRRKEEYQVDAIAALLAARGGVPIRVRIYESVQPLAARLDLTADAVFPNIENEYHIARPLLEANRAGTVPAPSFDTDALHDLDTEVFVMAARHDHTVDYRSQIALASSYKHATLFIADDNHVYARLKEGGVLDRLIRAFLLGGPGSSGMRRALEAVEPFRFIETD